MRITCWLLALALLLATVQAQRRTSSSRSSSSRSSSSRSSSSGSSSRRSSSSRGSRVRTAVSTAGSRIKSAASSLGSRIKSAVSSGGSRSSGSLSSSLLGGSSSSSGSLLGGSSSLGSKGSGNSGLSSTLKGLAGSVFSSSGSKTGSSSSGSGLGSTLKGLAGAALSSSGSTAGSSSSGSGLSSTLKGLAGAALGSSGSKTGSSSSGSGGLSSTLKGLAGSLASGSGSKTGSSGGSGSGLSSTLKGLAGAIGSSGTKTGSSSTSGSGLSSTLKGLAGAALGSKSGSSSSGGSKSSIVKSIAGALFKPNKNGVKQYSAYSSPTSSLGSHMFGSSKKSYGYKTPGYGTAWGTSFPGGLGEYKKRAGVSKKALGLGVGAGFLVGAGLGVAGTVATYSVYHRYQEFKRLRAQQGRGHFFDQNYYSNYYSSNQCQYGCPATTHCEWGLCECDAGTSRRFGRCQRSWNSAVPDTSLAVFKPCRSHPDCTSRDINLVCNTALTTGGEGRCECRPDMRWNSQAGECQLYLDVDCSRVTYTTQPSPAVLEAVRNLQQKQQQQPGQDIGGRTESSQEVLSSSLLSQLNPNTTTEDQLIEAYCRDVDALSFEFERQVVQGATTSPPRRQPGQSSGKPGLCAEVPSSACAVAYDSGDCGGGWVLPIAEGEQRFKFFSSFYTYRNDIDTVGVRAGCVLTAFEDSSFNGDQVTVRAGDTDRWVVLAQTPGFEHMSEQIESVKCQCDN